MSQLKWNAWFVLSIIWLFCMFMITLVMTSTELRMMGQNFPFVLTYSLCMINFIACVYVGCQPSEYEED